MSTADWWRRICWVTPQLACSGDLGDDIVSMKRHLAQWVDAGITHIVDVRIEADDTRFVARLAPHISYTWLGADDDHAHQSDDWFDAGATAITSAVVDPAARVMVHCRMGVNRGPSMTFAAMLAMAHDPVHALAAIRQARPVAAVSYAVDAVEWWSRRTGVPSSRAFELRRWMSQHPVDVDWITLLAG